VVCPERIAWCGERIIRRVTRPPGLFTRRGVRVQEREHSYPAKPDADGDKARTLRPMQTVVVTYRIAFGRAQVTRW
jgi:hypothetical protein